MCLVFSGHLYGFCLLFFFLFPQNNLGKGGQLNLRVPCIFALNVAVSFRSSSCLLLLSQTPKQVSSGFGFLCAQVLLTIPASISAPRSVCRPKDVRACWGRSLVGPRPCPRWTSGTLPEPSPGAGQPPPVSCRPRPAPERHAPTSVAWRGLHLDGS